MRSAQILRDKINSDRLTIGVIATFNIFPDLVEVCRNANLDFLIIDTEHMAFDEHAIAQACSIGRLIDFPVLIRPPESEYSFIRRVLDKGCVGLLLPQVQSAEHLDSIRDAVYMPPRGKRRVGGPGNRWVPNYNYDTWRRDVEDDLILLPQVESLVGLENVQAIARHELTTALAIGPYDLSTELRVCWQPESPKLLSALQKIRDAGRAAGKNTMMVGQGHALRKQGFNFMCVGEPTFVMEAALASLTSSLRENKLQGAAESHVP